MLRVVVDVNVLVSALVRRIGGSGMVVAAWRAGAFEVVVSERLLAELRDVLGRTAVARYFAQAEADALVAALERHATLVEDAPVGERLVPGHPGDDYLVALARAGRAQAIVTGGAHRLEAGVDPPAVTPGAFLARLEELGR